MNYSVKYFHLITKIESTVHFKEGTSIINAMDLCEGLALSWHMFSQVTLLETDLNGETRICHSYNLKP